MGRALPAYHRWRTPVLKRRDYTTADLYLLTDTLVKLGETATERRWNKGRLAKEQYVQNGSQWSFNRPGYNQLPHWHTGILPYKRPLFERIPQSNLGVTGYLNPFTNEAQVNTTVPAFLQPFMTCHEIAHQLGFAPEEDANFVWIPSCQQDARTAVSVMPPILTCCYTVSRRAGAAEWLSRQGSMWDKNSVPAYRRTCGN